MTEHEQQSEPTGCPVEMMDELPCGRPVYDAPSDVDAKPVCLMHSKDADKDPSRFWEEIIKILSGTSVQSHRPLIKDWFDFQGFIFPAVDFEGVVFERDVDFSDAIFMKAGNFREARFERTARFLETTFLQEANFISSMFVMGVSFDGAKFAQKTSFLGATFTCGASFSGTTFDRETGFSVARFTERADFYDTQFAEGVDFSGASFKNETTFSGTIFGVEKEGSRPPVARMNCQAIADFSVAGFSKPGLVRFLRVNERSEQGLRARFEGCLIEDVRFEAVHWYRQGGRMVLQDELDLLAGMRGTISHEVVAITYRRLINNFEKTRAYDLAEDCSIGAMEMKRLDPAQPIFVRGAVNFYRWASNYGSSYQRALGVLALMVLVFGLLYSLVGLTPRPGQTVLEPAGFIHAVEVATFKSETHAIAGSGAAWLLEILERVLIPAQVALFLLALRRRFRR